MAKKSSAGSLVLMLAALVCAPFALRAQEKPPDAQAVVLDTSGFWRFYLTLRTPVVREGDSLKEIGAPCNTPAPPADWTAVEFDDSGWVRQAGAPFAAWSRWEQVARANVGFIYCHQSSLALAQICLRAKFQVDDPAVAKGLKLAVTFRGGLAVCVNGKEIARDHLPQGALSPEMPAETYPREAYFLEDGDLPQGYGRKGSKSERLQLHLRTAEIDVPPSALRKGTNVLALSIHRAPLSADVYAKLKPLNGNELPYYLWDACGLFSARLTGPAGAAVRPNATRAAGVQVWNSDLLRQDTDLDWGDPDEPRRPVRISGTRNGSFSGKALVGSNHDIKGLKASVTALAGPRGAVIPASAVTLRYAAPDLPRRESDFNRFDSLYESPPAEAPARVKKADPNAVRILPGQPAPVYGAVVPVWLTVKIPADAAPGNYRGTLTVQLADVAQPPSAGAVSSDADVAQPPSAEIASSLAQAGAPVPHQPHQPQPGAAVLHIPVELRVAGFRLPDPKDYRTFVELVQSPDTLAVEYGAALWSDAHWKLIERSLALTGQVGAKTCYVPLIAETNMGNEQSMVRWTKQPDGSYRCDFSAMERYLDLVEKRQGPPTVVCFIVWDNFLEGGQFGDEVERLEGEKVREERFDYKGKGPEVTVLDGGKASKVMLPQYSEPGAKALWAPLAKELRERMKKRGLDKAMMLGLATDAVPAAAVVNLWTELLPGVPWASEAHPFRVKDIHGAPVGFTAAVWHPRFISYDGTSRQGWQNPKLMAQFARDVTEYNPLTVFRLIAEMNVGGDQRGFARWGADFWPVVRDRRGAATGRVYERYPKANWRNLNIKTAFLGPGPDGPVATARFEALREGVEECEARIFIEEALAGGKVPPALAERCKELIAERNRNIVMGLGVHALEGFQDIAAYWRIHDWHCNVDSRIGYYWYLASGWQAQSEKLYGAAAEVAAALGKGN
jgi:hypothetical protein